MGNKIQLHAPENAVMAFREGVSVDQYETRHLARMAREEKEAEILANLWSWTKEVGIALAIVLVILFSFGFTWPASSPPRDLSEIVRSAGPKPEMPRPTHDTPKVQNGWL